MCIFSCDQQTRTVNNAISVVIQRPQHPKLSMRTTLTPCYNIYTFSSCCAERSTIVCLFIATRAIFQLSGGCHHCRWLGCKFRPLLGAQGLWTGRDLHRATPTAAGPRFLRSHPKDRHPRPTVGFEPPMQGSLDLCARLSKFYFIESTNEVPIKQTLDAAKIKKNPVIYIDWLFTV
jgi:hypothetical protein